MDETGTDDLDTEIQPGDATPEPKAPITAPSQPLRQKPARWTPTEPDRPDITEMSHVLRVGREFGLILLYILAGTLAAFIVVVGFTEHQRVGQMDASLAQIFRIAGLSADPKTQTGLNADTLRAATELLKQVQQDQQQQRQFWQQLAQMVLLNLLLPLLTAVFGFVFGREQRDRDDRFNSPRRKEGGGG